MLGFQTPWNTNQHSFQCLPSENKIAVIMGITTTWSSPFLLLCNFSSSKFHLYIWFFCLFAYSNFLLSLHTNKICQGQVAQSIRAQQSQSKCCRVKYRHMMLSWSHTLSSVLKTSSLVLVTRPVAAQYTSQSSVWSVKKQTKKNNFSFLSWLQRACYNRQLLSKKDMNRQSITLYKSSSTSIVTF